MQRARDLKSLGGVGTTGIEVVLSVLFGLWLGTKLDEWLGTKPWMTILWFGFGCAAAGRAVYRSWKAMQAAAKREEAEEGNPPQAFPDEKALAWKREEEREREEALARAEAGEGKAENPSLENDEARATTRDQDGEAR